MLQQFRRTAGRSTSVPITNMATFYATSVGIGNPQHTITSLLIAAPRTLGVGERRQLIESRKR